jgi:hypothetical protein
MKLYLKGARLAFTPTLFEPKIVNSKDGTTGKPKFSVASIIEPTTLAYAGEKNPDSRAASPRSCSGATSRPRIQQGDHRDAATEKWGAKAMEVVQLLKAQNRLAAARRRREGADAGLRRQPVHELVATAPGRAQQERRALQASDGVIYPAATRRLRRHLAAGQPARQARQRDAAGGHVQPRRRAPGGRCDGERGRLRGRAGRSAGQGRRYGRRRGEAVLRIQGGLALISVFGRGSLHIDFETRSVLDLREVGLHRYARDPNTSPGAWRGRSATASRAGCGSAGTAVRASRTASVVACTSSRRRRSTRTTRPSNSRSGTRSWCRATAGRARSGADVLHDGDVVRDGPARARSRTPRSRSACRS